MRSDDRDDDLDISKPSQSGGADDLSTVDWLLCIFCGTIGCIVGIVRLIQGRPSGAKMIGLSILFSVILGILRFMLESMLATR